MYGTLYRRVLTRIDAETAHLLALAALERVGRFPALRTVLRHTFSVGDSASLRVDLFGRAYAHPLGVAAGFDKDARCLLALAALGFSMVEVGSVTPLAQPGNPRPRMFRLLEDEALINRMGFPSEGAAAVGGRLARRSPDFPVWVSLGKNKDTPLDNAAADYAAVLATLYFHADAFVINVSSPNTPQLRRLQTRDYLAGVLSALRSALEQNGRDGALKPLLLKIAPDLTDFDLDLILDTALAHKIDGIVATNTTLSRDMLHSSQRGEVGGLSGRPLRERTRAMVRAIHVRTGGRLPIVGVGGVFDGDDVFALLKAGARLVQSYTGFIYGGPGFAARTLARLRLRLRAEGVESVEALSHSVG